MFKCGHVQHVLSSQRAQCASNAETTSDEGRRTNIQKKLLVTRTGPLLVLRNKMFYLGKVTQLEDFSQTTKSLKKIKTWNFVKNEAECLRKIFDKKLKPNRTTPPVPKVDKFEFRRKKEPEG